MLPVRLLFASRALCPALLASKSDGTEIPRFFSGIDRLARGVVGSTRGTTLDPLFSVYISLLSPRRERSTRALLSNLDCHDFDCWHPRSFPRFAT